MKKIKILNKLTFLCLIVIGIIPTQLIAEIVLDGTLGAKGPVSGPTYNITPKLGQQVGNNLFHSFQTFNVNTGETAVFSGSASISNVIGRITGGDISTIDGTVSSEITGANLFLLNPVGFLIGENAVVDVPGGFYLSTADQLNLSDTGVFDASTPTNSSLTVDAPTAFGFVHENVGDISVNSTLNLLTVTDMVLTGGNIGITDSFVVSASGRVGIASVASSGSLPIDNLDTSDFETLGNVRIEDSTLYASEYESSKGGGEVVIRANSIEINNGNIKASTTNGNGGSVDIDVRQDLQMSGNSSFIEVVSSGAGQANDIHITSGADLILENQSLIQTRAFASGDVGEIQLNINGNLSLDNSKIRAIGTVGSTGKIAAEVAQNVALINNSELFTRADGAANAAQVDIVANKILVEDKLEDGNGTYLGSLTESTGKSGNVNLTANTSVFIDGAVFDEDNLNPIPTIGSGSDGSASGDAGDITVNTPLLEMSGGYFSTSAILQGAAGEITINVDDLITVNGSVDTSTFFSPEKGGDINIKASNVIKLNGSSAFLASFSAGNSNGGDITLDAMEVQLTNGGSIRTNSGYQIQKPVTETKGGSITITANNLNVTGGVILAETQTDAQGGDVSVVVDTLVLSNKANQDSTRSRISTSTSGEGSAGKIDLHAKSITFDDANIWSFTTGKGDAGIIQIITDQMTLKNGAYISADANTGSSGNGGDISVVVNKFLDLDGSNISHDRYTSHISTESRGVGSAGDISIRGGNITMKSGYISNSVWESGDGGDINIQVDNFDITNKASVSAVSFKSGRAGSISIAAEQGIRAKEGTKIQTLAVNSSGGRLILNSKGVIDIRQSEITSESLGLDSAASGGNVIVNGETLVLEDSSVYASSAFGKGGDIDITTDALIANEASIINASSILSVDGEITIDSNLDVSSNIQALPTPFLDATPLLTDNCTPAIYEENRSTLMVKPDRSIQLSPHSYMANIVPPLESPSIVSRHIGPDYLVGLLENKFYSFGCNLGYIDYSSIENL